MQELLRSRHVHAIPKGESPHVRPLYKLTWRKTVDQTPVSEDDPISELYEENAGHLTERHSAFFRKWDNLITVEEQELGRFRSQLWTMTAKDREKGGRCAHPHRS